MRKENDRSVAIRGGIWMSISTAVTMLSQLFRVMILTRYLEKSDFGIVAITNMVIGLCVTFTDLGFASVIMYKQHLSEKEFSSLYWVQFILFGVIYILLFAISPLLSSFYLEPILEIVIPIAALSVLGQAIGKLYDSVLLKHYYFKTLAYRNIVAVIISLVIAWWMAAQGYGVYSLVISTLIHIFIGNIWNLLSGYKLQPVRLFVKMREVMPLIKIGIYQTGTHILDFLSSKLDVIIIGKLLGTDALGIYDLAKELVAQLQ